MAEVEFGRMAEQKGQSDAVKEFGRRIRPAHGPGSCEGQ
jgi:predicted outer membrane protein